MRLVVDTNIFVSAALKDSSWPGMVVRSLEASGGLPKTAAGGDGDDRQGNRGQWRRLPSLFHAGQRPCFPEPFLVPLAFVSTFVYYL
jgi:hypothetical protein